MKSILDTNINIDDDAMGLLVKSLKEKGYFFTDIEVCKCLGAIGEILKPKTILDPSCGVGEILYYCNYGNIKEAYSHDLESIKAAKDMLENCSFYHKSFLEEQNPKKYDLIVSQFPIGPRKDKDGGEFYPDLAYVEKSLQALEKNGALLAIVPEGFLNEKYSEGLRRAILEKYSLEMVIHLPMELMPELKRNTAIILIKNSPQRAKVYIDHYKRNVEEIIVNYQERSGELWISADELMKRWDFHYHYYSIQEVEDYFKGRHYKYLKDMASISRGVLIVPSMLKTKGHYRIFDGNHVEGDRVIAEGKDVYYTDRAGEDFILQDGDIAVNLFLDTEVKFYQYKKSDPPTMVGAKYAIIRSKDNDYIASYLSTKVAGEEIFIKQLNRLMKGTRPNVSIEDLGNVKIPILTDEDLNTLTPEGVKKAAPQQMENFMENIIKFAEMIDIMQSKRIAQQAQEALAPIIEELSFGIKILKDFQKEKTNNLEKEKNEKIGKKLDYAIQVITNVNKEQGTLHRRIDKMEDSMGGKFRGFNSDLQEMKGDLKEVTGDTKEIKIDIKEVKDDIKTVMHMLEELDKELKVLRKETEDKLKKIKDEWSREEIYKDFADKLWDAFEQKYNEEYGKKENEHYHSVKDMLIEKFGVENWEKLNPDSRTYLITARVVYDNMKRYDDQKKTLDFSPCCIALTKALERELFINVFERMKDYYKTPRRLLPNGLIETVENEEGRKEIVFQKDKSYSLRSVMYLLGVWFNKGYKHYEKEKIKNMVKDFFQKKGFRPDAFENRNELWKYLKKFCDDINDIAQKYRNQAAHKDGISVKTADECYSTIIDGEKLLIKFMDKVKAEPEEK